MVSIVYESLPPPESGAHTGNSMGKEEKREWRSDNEKEGGIGKTGAGRRDELTHQTL